MSITQINIYKTPNGAIFDKPKNRRFILWRTWSIEGPYLLFIGINPSTAGESENDPTINRLIKIAKEWNYAGFFMINLFSWVSPKRNYSGAGEKIVEIENIYIEWAEVMSDTVIFMWGNDGNKYPEIVERMMNRFPIGHCFGQNKNGQPTHPLYLPEPLHLKPFNRKKLWI